MSSEPSHVTSTQVKRQIITAPQKPPSYLCVTGYPVKSNHNPDFNTIDWFCFWALYKWNHTIFFVIIYISLTIWVLVWGIVSRAVYACVLWWTWNAFPLETYPGSRAAGPRGSDSAQLQYIAPPVFQSVFVPTRTPPPPARCSESSSHKFGHMTSAEHKTE